MIPQRAQNNQKKNQNLISEFEVKILKLLFELGECTTPPSLEAQEGGENVNIADITGSCEESSNDDVLRALYTLEGKSLVHPDPEGDFTSALWKISPIGVRALAKFS
jgi:hypothetical protein